MQLSCINKLVFSGVDEGERGTYECIQLFPHFISADNTHLQTVVVCQRAFFPQRRINFYPEESFHFKRASALAASDSYANSSDTAAKLVHFIKVITPLLFVY